MCVYFNLEKNCDLIKAIYWNNKWCQWNPTIKIENQVKAFLNDSRANYYTECLAWCEDNNDITLFKKD